MMDYTIGTMKVRHSKIVVAGHICLDIIPQIPASAGGIKDLMVPGKLIDVGTALISTGGAVPNTGGALHRLGMDVQLMGKVGKDHFGNIVLEILKAENEELATGMIVSDSDRTSYTLVINPPDVDRIFLHCPGANDTFLARNIDYSKVAEAALFHFGYPPLMRSMYMDNGAELVEIFRRVKERGVTTSLDMALPDPNSPAGKADWPAILEAVLPYVDIFMPSLDEILYMTGHTEAESETDTAVQVARRLMDWGTAIVMVKLGDRGACLATSDDADRLSRMGTCAPADIAAWTGVSFGTPCFDVRVVGTTGAGDCTIAGFLAGFVRGMTPEETLTAAVATGACSVEAPDAIGGILDWDTMQQRINSGWKRAPAG